MAWPRFSILVYFIRANKMVGTRSTYIRPAAELFEARARVPRHKRLNKINKEELGPMSPKDNAPAIQLNFANSIKIFPSSFFS